MSGKSFLINVLASENFSVSILIDVGCKKLVAINSFVRKANLLRMKITPRRLTGTTGEDENKNKMITQKTQKKLDVYGCSRKLYPYIIPRLSHSHILGKP